MSSNPAHDYEIVGLSDLSFLQQLPYRKWLKHPDHLYLENLISVTTGRGKERWRVVQGLFTVSAKKTTYIAHWLDWMYGSSLTARESGKCYILACPGKGEWKGTWGLCSIASVIELIHNEQSRLWEMHCLYCDNLVWDLKVGFQPVSVWEWFPWRFWLFPRSVMLVE